MTDICISRFLILFMQLILSNRNSTDKEKDSVTGIDDWGTSSPQVKISWDKATTEPNTPTSYSSIPF